MFKIQRNEWSVYVLLGRDPCLIRLLYQVMHETAMSQVSALIRMTSVPHATTGRGKDVDILFQARIFWHAYTTEGITNGLYGGRLVL